MLSFYSPSAGVCVCVCALAHLNPHRKQWLEKRKYALIFITTATVAAQLQCWSTGSSTPQHTDTHTHSCTEVSTCFLPRIDSCFDAWECWLDVGEVGVFGYRATWPVGPRGVRGTLIFVSPPHVMCWSLEGPHILSIPSFSHGTSLPPPPMSWEADRWGQVNPACTRLFQLERIM